MSTALHAITCKQQNSTSKTLSCEAFNNENSQKKSANRRSAVERLEETKANYVKTERVLDCKQNFEHSSNLHVSNGPKIDVLLKERIKSIYNCQSIIQYVHTVDLAENSNNVPSLTKDASSKTCNVFDTKVKAHGKADSNILQRKKYGELFESDVYCTDSQIKLRSLSAEKSPQRHSVKPDLNPCLNANVHVPEVNCSPINSWQRKVEAPICNYASVESTELQDEPSDNEDRSSAASRDSFSCDDVMELEDKQHGSRTSDYVSRSSSFKCSLSSDRVKNLVKSFESRMSNSNQSPSRTLVNDKGKSVSRSKSDVSGRFSKGLHVAPESTAVDDIELERFFNGMGLDTGMWHSLTTPSRSPVHFFDSISSLNSEDHHSSVCSEDSTPEVHREGLTNSDLQKHAPTETSIVEKNARVVKWLYNCHNTSRKATS